MMDYDKIYERVMRRGDEILEQRRKKAVRIKQTSYAVSGVCAAVITGVGIWRMTDMRKLPDSHFSEIETVEDITTTKEIPLPVTTSADTTTNTGKYNHKESRCMETALSHMPCRNIRCCT